MKQSIIVICLLVIIVVSVQADETHPRGIILDRTIGSAVIPDLSGPHYKINAEYGHQAGTNLFHSFQQFNILSDESATFMGPDSVQNIISRVTGGNSSWIDGNLRSDIPGADLYLLNPAGLMFGPNASLDIGGSFHVSTADYLSMGQNERFYTIPRENDVLSAAAPNAFGFLDNGAASISFEGRGEITEAEWKNNPTGISVSKGNTVSIVGGDIEIKKGTYYKTLKIDENNEPVTEIIHPGDIKAPQGQIIIASTQSADQIEISTQQAVSSRQSAVSSWQSTGNQQPGNQQPATITISDKSLVDVSGSGGGTIYIRGERFIVSNSTLSAKTLGDKEGGTVDIRVAEMSFTNGAQINCDTEGKGKGANIEIHATDSAAFDGEDTEIKGVAGRTGISTATRNQDKGAGSAGSLLIEAGNISLSSGAFINSTTYGPGKGGDVNLKASESVSLTGQTSDAWGSAIQVATGYENQGAGTAGSLVIEAENISFSDGAYISSATYGPEKGGEVTLKASETVSFAGEDTMAKGSRIQLTTDSKKQGAGSGGSLVIEADNISFTGGAYINSTTYGRGKGGEVTLRASDVNFAGEASNADSSRIQLSTIYKDEKAGTGGDLLIDAGNIYFADGAYINSNTYGTGNGGGVTLKASEEIHLTGENTNKWASRIEMVSLYEWNEAGAGGSLLMEADNISLTSGAYINSLTRGKGKGGEVTLKASENVTFGGEDSNAQASSIQVKTVFKGENAGPGGSVLIEANNILFRDGAAISGTTLGKGTAGNITVLARENLIFTGRTSDGKASNLLADVSQDSNGGKGGEISVQAENILLTHGAGIVTASKSENSKGDAGMIAVNSNGSVTLLNGSSITTEATNAGGGEISVNAEKILYLSDSSITSSVMKGRENGGDIKIANQGFVILNQGKIIAKAYEGDGGNIHITADQFIKSSDSSVDASSQLGIDGSVQIESPNADVGSGITVLPDNFPDASHWMKTPCTRRSAETLSRFVIKARESLPVPPDGYLASPPHTITQSVKTAFSHSAKRLSEFSEYYDKGDFELAAQSLEQLALSVDAEKNIGIYLDILAYLSNAYQAIGHNQKALKALQKALPMAEQSRPTADAHTAQFFSTLGDLHLSLGNKDKASKYLEKGISKARIAKYPYVLAGVLNNKGNALMADSDINGAISAYNESLEVIQNAGDNQLRHFTALKSKILINIVRAVFLAGNYQDIIKASDNALAHIKGLPDYFNKGADIIALGSLLTDIIQDQSFIKQVPVTSTRVLISETWKIFNKAEQIAIIIENPRIAAYSCGYMGQLYKSQGRYSEAVNLTGRAIFYAQQGYYPEILYLWQWEMGKLLTVAGDIEKAVKYYYSATETLNLIRQELLREYRSVKNRFYKNVRPVYLELVELLLKQAEMCESSYACEEKLKEARNTMELLKKAELQNFFEDECVSVVQKKITTLDRAPSNTLLLCPIPLADSLALLLTLPTGIKQVRVPVQSDNLVKTVKQFQRDLQTRSSYRYKDNAKKLFNWLIKPIEDELDAHKIDTLVIAPEGALRLIPFSALHDGHRFLVEKYAVVTVPGITLIDHKPLERGKINILINGLSEARQGFSSLPNVPKELDAIKAVMESKLLKDKDYTVGNLTREFKNNEYTIVHMATHGVFGSSSKKTYLLAYDGKLTMNRLEQLMDYSRFRDNPVDLLTLSACQTAMGDERAALGLAGVAVKAGVRSAIATLWFIDDEATCLAISEFYRQLKSSEISKAKALQNAQKKLLARQRYRHPVYWAPFLLIGNWL